MSYILDALRRAEADRERERGQVPGLHAQPLPGSAPAAGTGPRRWLPWAGAGLLLLAGLGAGSWWASGPPDSAAPTPPAAPVAAVPPQAPPLPPRPVTAAAPTAAVASAAVPQPAPAASASPYLPPVPPAPPAAVVAPATEARIPRLAELPESTRRELPRLAISGSVYSDDAASRFVIVNGEVVREGANLGGELVLEQIRPRELVLRFRGQRYRQALQGQ